MNTNPNDSVHPRTVPSDDFEDDSPFYTTEDLPGLTKREYFAGLAMQGIMSNIPGYPATDLQCAAAADKCVKMADTLITALNKKEG